MVNFSELFKIRAITGFVHLERADFAVATHDEAIEPPTVEIKIARTFAILVSLRERFQQAGYTVQSIRIATNPFPQWLSCDNVEQRQQQLMQLETYFATLEENITLVALGPAETASQVEECCPHILKVSQRFFCSAKLSPTDCDMAGAVARTIQHISTLDRAGMTNFRFTMIAMRDRCDDTNPISIGGSIPFFPAAHVTTSTTTVAAADHVEFAIGMENGALTHHLLQQCSTIEQIPTVFRQGMLEAYEPLQRISEQASRDLSLSSFVATASFLGMDVSVNPSLDAAGSVARAFESLIEVKRFSGPGTLAAAAAVTTALQSLSPQLTLTGYCGIMLPLCEDERMAELTLASSLSSSTPATPQANSLRIADLLGIGHVCGVGIDTIPIPGDFDLDDLSSLLLDVSALAHRWGKKLCCRVFPVPGKKAGERTDFDSPYLVNAHILPLS